MAATFAQSTVPTQVARTTAHSCTSSPAVPSAFTTPSECQTLLRFGIMYTETVGRFGAYATLDATESNCYPPGWDASCAVAGSGPIFRPGSCPTGWEALIASNEFRPSTTLIRPVTTQICCQR